jgi:cytoskeletal protein CcmA (bactofilin family)
MMPIENTTVIGRSTQIRGEVSGVHDLLVEGDIEGVVRLSGARLTVQPQGHICAKIQAQDLIVFGRIEGEVRIAGQLDLRKGSVVLGDIFAARISIEDGAVLRGRFDPSRAAEPLPESAQPVSTQVALLHQTLDAWLAPETQPAT